MPLPMVFVKGCEQLTNINCSKACEYQKDGKCACDNVMLPFWGANVACDAECPYLTLNDKQKETAVN